MSEVRGKQGVESSDVDAVVERDRQSVQIRKPTEMIVLVVS